MFLSLIVRPSSLFYRFLSYLVLINFSFQTLMPSYVWASQETLDYRRTTSNIMFRTKALSSVSTPEGQSFLAEDNLIDSSIDGDEVVSVHHTGGLLSDGEESVMWEASTTSSDIMSLDDLLAGATDDELDHAGYVFKRVGGDLHVSLSAFSQASGVLHIVNPQGAVILEEAMSFAELLIQAKGFTTKGLNVSGSLALDLMNQDGQRGT